MTNFYLVSTKPGTDKKFRVISYDQETKKGCIIGTMGVEFDADMSKEALLKSGYKVMKEG